VIVTFCSGVNRNRKYFVSLEGEKTVRDQGTKYDVFAQSLWLKYTACF